MDTPSNSPDKWKLSGEASAVLLFFFFFFFAAATVVGFCAAAVLRKRRMKMEQRHGGDRQAEEGCNSTIDGGLTEKQLEVMPFVCSWAAIKKLLAASCLRWTEATQTVNGSSSDEKADQGLEQGVWNGRGSTTVSPLWQRRILMGDKCELPRFSGLILYNEHGLPLQTSSSMDGLHQEKAAAAAVVTTLKDLL